MHKQLRLVLTFVKLSSKAKVNEPQGVPGVAVIPPEHDVARRQVKMADMADAVQREQRLHSNQCCQSHANCTNACFYYTCSIHISSKVADSS